MPNVVATTEEKILAPVPRLGNLRWDGDGERRRLEDEGNRERDEAGLGWDLGERTNPRELLQDG